MKFFDWIRILAGLAVAGYIAYNMEKIMTVIEEEIYYADTSSDYDDSEY